MDLQNQELNLTECDKEQIQFIENIQSFGALLVLDADNVIRHAAAIKDFELDTQGLIGKSITQVFGSDLDPVLHQLTEKSDSSTPIMLKSARWKRWLTCLAHIQEGKKILELEFLPTKETEYQSVKFLRERREPLYNYLQHIADSLREMTDYDRVMVYRFHEDWHGEVVAEAVAEGIYTFMGHHFPASDIPLPARQLFIKNWIRIIADVDKPVVPLVGDKNDKVDLSRSVLRSPSPIHLEYLRNMGVKASMTLSILLDGELWGLIACHHLEPKYLTAEERSVCALIAKLVSSRVSTFNSSESITINHRVSSFISKITANEKVASFAELLEAKKHELAEYVDADGFFALTPKHVVSVGDVLDSSSLQALTARLNEKDKTHYTTDSLKIKHSQLGLSPKNVAGVLAVKANGVWIGWCRNELVQSRLWAGDPNEKLYALNKGERLNPRLSFGAWKEDMTGHSKIWEPVESSMVKLLGFELSRFMEGGRQVAPSPVSPEYEKLMDSIRLQAKKLSGAASEAFDDILESGI